MKCSILCIFNVALVTSVAAEDQTTIEFARDILPVLSENCFFCHGPDEANREADLRLDTEEGFVEVVDAEDRSGSEILNRIFSDDHDTLMPPPDSNRRLTSLQKDTIRRWIINGARWGKHWSFEAIRKADPPAQALPAYPVHNEIDSFVQQKLASKGMTPSLQAPKSTLLRRLALDLTGLPPAPDVARDFLADESDGAYEILVDRLLASQSFGERMAWDWLDAARYADSNGYQGDRERTMWPWRDWVIDAFNRNMPFDEFTVNQLAGDLLPNATFEQRLATGFCRNHMINGEGGRIPEENRVDYVMDMSETMGTVWLGLTLNCCRCHDHKYDPLTQKDYYQFFAYFNQTPVTGGGGDPATAPNMPAPTVTDRQRLKEISAAIDESKTRLATIRQKLMPELPQFEAQTMASGNINHWEVLTPVEFKAKQQQLRLLDDKSLIAEGPNPSNDTYTVSYRLPAGIVSSLQLDALPHSSMTKGGLARSDSGNFVLTEIELHQRTSNGHRRIEIKAAKATFEQGGHAVATSFDENSKTGWAVWNGKPLNQGHSAVFHLANPIDSQDGERLEVIFRHDSPHQNHNLGRFRLSATSKLEAEIADVSHTILADLTVPREKRTPEQQQRILDAFLETSEEFKDTRQTLAGLDAQKARIEKSAPRVMVMADRAESRTTFVLNRGLYNDVTDKQVTAATPLSLPSPTAAAAQQNRLDLANWLLSKEHPLTARVTVNRFWQQFFGIGLVKTTEDFGVQGEYPEYLALLDWLAYDFREHGWDVKRLVKQIVMSHTYRQSSIVRDSNLEAADGSRQGLAEVDPENRLLARASRFRLPSWMLRDQALAASGLLNSTIGGPPVNTYQPAGVWEEATFGKKKYKQDTGDKLYRRSLYIFWRRIIAPTMFFDNASRQNCSVKSSRTNTPLHALLTLNETTYIEAARTLAQILLTDAGLSDDNNRLQTAFSRILFRKATAGEVAVLLRGLKRNREQFLANPTAASALLTVGESARADSVDAIEHAAWTTLCLTLLNTDEALTRE